MYNVSGKINSTTMSSVRSPPLTKQEVTLLIDLIRDNSVVLSKQTNAGSNKMKEKAWQVITDEFNSRISSCPRRESQLKFKWDNLKKAARKREANKKYRIEGVYLRPDDILDRVLLLLDSVSDSGDSGSNSEAPNTRRTDESDMEVENRTIIKCEENPDPQNEMKTLSGTHSEMDSDSDDTGDGVETPMLSDVLKSPNSRARVIERRRSDIVRKNIAIAEYYEAKKKKVDLEIRKLQLEIDLRLNHRNRENGKL